MKNKMFAVAIFAASLGGGTALIASNAFAKSPAPAAAADKHPDIRKALNQLGTAMKTMKNSADDFAGHKSDAMKDTQHAIDELHTAMKDAKH